MLSFSGSRNLSAASCQIARLVLAAAAASGQWSSIGVGDCPSGLDSSIYSSPVFQSHRHRVFRAKSRSPRHLVHRSVELVETTATFNLGTPCGFVAFPGKPCPSLVIPSKSAVKCFCGAGSGTWASAALAVGRGVPLWVGGLPQSSLPLSWGTWSRSPRFPGCWQLTPQNSFGQLPLF